MKTRLLLYAALFLICVILSACAGAQTVLDSVLVQAGVDIRSTQTAQAGGPENIITPAPNIRNFIPTPTQGSGKVGENILVVDDFSDPSSGWNVSSDDVSTNEYADGDYSITLNKAKYCTSASFYRTFSDVTVDVDTQRISGTDQDEYGLICRLMDNKNQYFLGITGDCHYGIGKLINDDWLDPYDNNWMFTREEINTGNATNHLKAICDFDTLKFEVNGQPLIKTTDSDLRSGEVGVYVCAYDEPGVQVLFDNFVVSTIP